MSVLKQHMVLPAHLGSGPKKLLIGGQWVPALSGKTFDSINPSTGEIIARIAEGDRDDVDRAVDAARQAMNGPWTRFTPVQRQNVLLKLGALVEEHFDELYMLDSLDMGMPIGFIRGTMSAEFAAEILRYYAGLCTKFHGETIPNSSAESLFTYTLKEPVGVVGSIIPWNAPLMETIWKVAPVLASGCTMVLKPAEEASLSPLRFGELLQELDLPDGVVNIVTGFGETAGAALSGHPAVDKISFTGSSFTGQEIVRAAAGNLKRVSLELGGKSPHIVFADARIESAVAAAGIGVFFNSGQNCASGSRIFVQRPIYDEFVERLSNHAASLLVGNSVDSRTQIGPLVSEAQLNRVTGYLDIGAKEGARTTVGGRRLIDGDLARGYFVAPTVFADVQDEMRVAQEEIFGPVACVIPFDSTSEVIERANNTIFGLAGGVWTQDISNAHRVAQSIRTGVMWVNTYNKFDPAVPYGGYKMSGWGKELGSESLDDYLNTKSVWIRTDS
jgi:aldehyde dehydrogenase (NAD+)